MTFADRLYDALCSLSAVWAEVDRIDRALQPYTAGAVLTAARRTW